MFSPFGVRSVDLLFEDGRVRVPAAVLREKNLFARELPKRPDGVPEHTDVQAEITDGRGEKIRLQYYWIDWR